MLDAGRIVGKKKDLDNMHVIYLYQNKERILITILISATLQTMSSLLSASIFAGHNFLPDWRAQVSFFSEEGQVPIEMPLGSRSIAVLLILGCYSFPLTFTTQHMGVIENNTGSPAFQTLLLSPILNSNSIFP